MRLYNDLQHFVEQASETAVCVCVRVEMTFCTERRDVCIGLVIIYFSPSLVCLFNSLGSQL